MTPSQFESYVAHDFERQGFAVEFTARSYDYGVDLVASNGTTRIAIQAKYWNERKVNYKELMYLYAGAKLYQCENSILITSGDFEEKAISVAEKLEIQTVSNFPTEERLEFTSSRPTDRKFDSIWDNCIKGLIGKELKNSRGGISLVLKVTDEQVFRVSSNNKQSTIPREIFRLIYHRLCDNGEVSRTEINTEYPGRASSFIILVLAEVPGVELRSQPLRLTLS